MNVFFSQIIQASHNKRIPWTDDMGLAAKKVILLYQSIKFVSCQFSAVGDVNASRQEVRVSHNQCRLQRTENTVLTNI